MLHYRGIEDIKVLEAMSRVPRHLFIDSALEAHAYELKAFPIAASQTISNPYTVAFQSQLLDIQSGDTILEVGTGSGYQTAVLLEMGATVFTVERQKSLFNFSKNLFKKFSYYPRYQSFGDGFKGLPSFAQFDKILVTAAAPFIPIDLKDQLKIGGLMVIPVETKSTQKMKTVLRIDEEICKVMDFGQVKFVPMLKKRHYDENI